MAFRDDEFQGDLGVLLDNLWADLSRALKEWDHKNGGHDGRSNKQIYLAAQKISGKDIDAGPAGFDEAKAILVTAAASRILYPGL